MRVGFFAGTPAPTGIPQNLKAVVSLWERACPRRGQSRSIDIYTHRNRRNSHHCPTASPSTTMQANRKP
ncbi:hypothetical protein PPUN12996_33720 [Pseudomonas putida]|nr:hypothetical protein KAM380_038130 [Aeromonas caviae]GLO31315.1 hypothetical protein PPUN12996_33720 [Pseudomonas putida]